jgi:hypothetical protein
VPYVEAFEEFARLMNAFLPARQRESAPPLG